MQVSADNGTNWMDLSPDYTADSSGGWTRPSLDLSAYAGQSVRVGFYFESHDLGSYGAEVGLGWYIDEVTVVTGTLPAMPTLESFEDAGAGDAWVADFGIWEVGAPTSGPGAAHLGANCLATILSGNYTDDRTSR